MSRGVAEAGDRYNRDEKDEEGAKVRAKKEIKKGFEELKEWLSLTYSIHEESKKSNEESLSAAELLQSPQYVTFSAPVVSTPIPTQGVTSQPSYIDRTHQARHSPSNQCTIDCDEVSSTQTEEEKSTTSKTNTVSTRSSLEERKAVYSEARQRIFSEDDSEIKELVTPKPRNIPVVARRMIAHALGQRVSSNSSGGLTSAAHNEPEQKNQELSGREKSLGHQNLNLRNSRETAAISIQELSSQDRKIVDKSQVRHAAISERGSESKIQKKPSGIDKSVNCVPPPNGRMGQATSKDNLEQEHLGAAKRMFAQALCLNGTKELNGLVLKANVAIPTDKD